MQSTARTPQIYRAALAATLAVLLGGATRCSYRGHDVGGSTSSAQITSGPLSRFGSEFINGVEFQTGTAALALDGDTVLETQLRVGQIATITGAVAGATGTATRVDVTNKLVGPVTGVDLAAGTVTVLGQTIRLRGDTSVGPGVAPTDVGGLLLGQVVAVDGYRTSDGLIATRFDRLAVTSAYRASGRVSNLLGSQQTFMLAGTIVDWSGVSGALPASVANGSYVIASGSTLGGLTTLRATSVRAVDELARGANGAPGSVHGAITRYGSATDFDVAGQPISVGAAPTYLNGGSGDLALDVELEATGNYDSAGALAASTVDVRPVPQVRVVGSVDAVDSTVKSLSIAGITLSTNARTRWDDRSAAALRTFDFGDLRSGDWVEVRGVAGVNAAATVDVLERRVAPSTPLVELQDVPAAIADPAFTLTGIAVDTRAATFADVTGHALTRASFFNAVAGKRVRVRGTLAGVTLNAQTVVLRE